LKLGLRAAPGSGRRRPAGLAGPGPDCTVDADDSDDSDDSDGGSDGVRGCGRGQWARHSIQVFGSLPAPSARLSRAFARDAPLNGQKSLK
jgi:hypothetical protein